MYEHRRQKLLTRREFGWRLLRHAVWVALLVAASLGAGLIGFHFAGGLPWLDAFMNSAMLLGGMGLVGDMDPPAGKIFASLYALYSGLLFLIAAGVLFAPVLHRVMHRLHLDIEKDGE